MSGHVTDKHAEDVCRVGKGPVCCAFLLMAASGWQCAKADPFMKAQIDKRRSSMKAKGDNCGGPESTLSSTGEG